MKVKLMFAWYDFWVGVFWDQKKRMLYIFPLPMCGVSVFIPRKKRKIDPSRCQADGDGHCVWVECPQLKDRQSYCIIAAENEKEEGYFGY